MTDQCRCTVLLNRYYFVYPTIFFRYCKVELHLLWTIYYSKLYLPSVICNNFGSHYKLAIHPFKLVCCFNQHTLPISFVLTIRATYTLCFWVEYFLQVPGIYATMRPLLPFITNWTLLIGHAILLHYYPSSPLFVTLLRRIFFPLTRQRAGMLTLQIAFINLFYWSLSKWHSMWA